MGCRGECTRVPLRRRCISKLLGWVFWISPLFPFDLLSVQSTLQSLSLHISNRHVGHLKLTVICQLCLSKKRKKKKELQVSNYYCSTTYFSIQFCQFLLHSLRFVVNVRLYKCYISMVVWIFCQYTMSYFVSCKLFWPKI